MGNSGGKTTFPPLETVSQCETSKIMGTWFVIAVKPTPFEKTCSNAVEQYFPTTDDNKRKKKHDVDIKFTYNANEPIVSKVKQIGQKAWIQGPDKSVSGDWKVSPLPPLKLPFPIIEVDTDSYDYLVVGYPSRAYCWIMSRTPEMKPAQFEMISERLTTKHQYDMADFRKVPQQWTKDERTKRGLDDIIPDSYLKSDAATTKV